MKLSPQRRLFMVSLLMLWLSWLVVRLSGSQMSVLAYIPYPLPAAALLGLSMGLLRQQVRREPLGAALGYLVQLVLVLVLVRFLNLGRLGLVPDSSTYFHSLFFHSWLLGQELLTSAVILSLMALTFGCFRGFGEETRRLAAAAGPPRAASHVLLGAAAGAALIAASSSLNVHAVLLSALVLCLWLALARLSAGNSVACLLVLIGTWSLSFNPATAPAGAAGDIPPEIWSPYQQLQTMPLRRGNDLLALVVAANGVAAQTALDLSMSAQDWQFLQSAWPSLGLNVLSGSFYDVPYRVAGKPGKVLVLGAGTGNDVAAALSHGAASVDAVEIDPALLSLGLYHPRKPYGNAAVNAHVADARAFLAGHAEKYDLIVIGKLDSVLASTPLSPVRQSDFVYTTEGLSAVKQHLAPGGYLAVAAGTHRKWLLERLVRNMQEVFRIVDGAVVLVGGQYLMASAEHADDAGPILSGAPGVVAAPETIALNERALGMEPTTDEWPFLFAQHRAIPLPYLWSMYLAGGFIMLVARRPVAGWMADIAAGAGGKLLYAFCLGVSFVLLLGWAVLMCSLAAGGTMATIAGAAAAVFLLGWLAALWARAGASVPVRVVWAALFLSLAGNFLLMPGMTSSVPPDAASMPFAAFTNRAIVFALLLAPPFLLSFLIVTALRLTNCRAQFAAAVAGGSAVGLILPNFAFMAGVRISLVLAAGFLALSLTAARTGSAGRRRGQGGAGW